MRIYDARWKVAKFLHNINKNKDQKKKDNCSLISCKNLITKGNYKFKGHWIKREEKAKQVQAQINNDGKKSMHQEVTSSFPLFCKLGFHVDNVEVTSTS